MDGASSEPEVRLALGTRAPWAGPATFALAAAVYAAALAFEGHANSGRRPLHQLFAGLGSADLSPGEVVAHVEWRATVFLLVGGCVAAAAVAARTIFDCARTARPQLGVIAGLGLLALLAYRQLSSSDNPVALMQQLQLLVERNAGSTHAREMASLAMLPKRCAEAVAFLVGAGAASTVILPATIDAAALARRVRALRLLLYVSAVLFVLAVAMTEATYSWLTTLFPGGGQETSAALAGLVSAGTMSAGAFYSLLLAAIYLPAAAILGEVGRRLAESASAGDSDEERASWLEQNGLAISWKGQLARIGTLLTPLASSAVAGLLTSGVA